MTPDTQEAFDKILNCFSAADGGVSFARVKMLIEDLDAQADEQTRAGHDAAQIINIVRRFSRLIDAASEGY